MRVLVTGDRGYIGSVLVEKLLTAGFDVVGLDSDFFEDNFEYFKKAKTIKVCKPKI